MNKDQGWLNLYKPKNISSFHAIKKVKALLDIKKIGHAGTLDPLAEGILPIAIGKTTKLIPYLIHDQKKYIFTIKWGQQTSTDDSEGDILFSSEIIPKYNQISSSLKKFRGNFLQTPPKASAVKIDGKRAYKLLRENKNFNTNPKKVYVKKLEIISNHKNSTLFEIECGKGFYIRSLARDLGIELGTYGHIISLERIKVGKFTKESSILLDDLIKISERLTQINCINTSVSMLDDILAFEIEDDQDIKSLSLGKSINIDESKFKKFSSDKFDRNKVFISNKGDIISIGKLIGNLFKPKKVLI